MQKYNFQKISYKKGNQNPSRYYNFVTNLKFQHKPKYHLSKNPQIKMDLFTKGPISLKLLYSIMNLNTKTFALVETRPTKCTLKRKKTARKTMLPKEKNEV
jgi:hypothetical protein